MSARTRLTGTLALALVMAQPAGLSAQALRLQAAPPPLLVASASPAPTSLSRDRAGTLTITRRADASSERLRQAHSSGAAFATLVLNVQQPGRSAQPYLTVTLYSVKVTSYSVNASGLDDGSIPTETLSLNFDRINW